MLWVYFTVFRCWYPGPWHNPICRCWISWTLDLPCMMLLVYNMLLLRVLDPGPTLYDALGVQYVDDWALVSGPTLYDALGVHYVQYTRMNVTGVNSTITSSL
jgi:hypothetical protein